MEKKKLLHKNTRILLEDTDQGEHSGGKIPDTGNKRKSRQMRYQAKRHTKKQYLTKWKGNSQNKSKYLQTMLPINNSYD